MLRPAVHATTFDASHLAALLAAREAVPAAPGIITQAVTVWDSAIPLCCFGISSPWPGLGMAWCEERDPQAMHTHGRQIGRLLKHYWTSWLADGQYQRIESRAPATHLGAQRLVQWLGFQLVSAKPHYGPHDQTVLEYVYYPEGT